MQEPEHQPVTIALVDEGADDALFNISGCASLAAARSPRAASLARLRPTRCAVPNTPPTPPAASMSSSPGRSTTRPRRCVATMRASDGTHADASLTVLLATSTSRPSPTPHGTPAHPVLLDAPRDLARSGPAAVPGQLAVYAVDPEEALTYTLLDAAALHLDLASPTSGQLRLVDDLTESADVPTGTALDVVVRASDGGGQRRRALRRDAHQATGCYPPR